MKSTYKASKQKITVFPIVKYIKDQVELMEIMKNYPFENSLFMRRRKIGSPVSFYLEMVNGV